MIVAMALVATLGIAVFAWVNTTLANLNRIDQHMRRETVLDNALAFIQTINPMQEPQGEHLLGAYRIKWHSRPMMAAPRRSRGSAPNVSGLYELNLFTVTVSVFEKSLLFAEFEVQLAGYRRFEESTHRLK